MTIPVPSHNEKVGLEFPGESTPLRGTGRCAMRKLSVVRLTNQERGEIESVVKKRKGNRAESVPGSDPSQCQCRGTERDR
jgi:hypothetical protein